MMTLQAPVRSPEWTVGELADAVGAYVATGAGLHVRGVQEDSRRCSPGDLFIAVAGEREDGLRYAADAVARGAVAVVADRDPGPGVPWVRVASARLAAGALADLVYGDPSGSLALVGVTGTNGKTTTAHLIAQLVPGPAGVIGTTGIYWPGGAESSPNTTPGPTALRRHLRTMVEAGCGVCAAEISSHALEQRRADGLRFAVAVYTNLTRDHLDYHGTMERYAAAKARLFALLDEDATAVVNDADPVARAVETRARVVRFHAEQVVGGPGGTRFRWRGREATVPLVGRHNAANAVAALEAACAIGADPDEALQQLARVLPPRGRLEPVQSSPFLVLVDYAHTEDALEKALHAVREITAGKVSVVFGCGGDRDRGKRPRMGAVAGRLADRVTVTSDNPRSEDPSRIAQEVLAGVGRRGARVELDRRAAIRLAIEEAASGDTILIAGKGHEDYQIVGERRHPFDDVAVAREALGGKSH